MRKDKDMTVGNPFKLIGTFSFSLIVGNLFQQLYTFVDTIIIGKKIGTLGLAAVGGTEWLIFLANGVVIGLVQGFCILLGNSFGEGNEQEFDVYYVRAKKICFVACNCIDNFSFSSLQDQYCVCWAQKMKCMPWPRSISILFSWGFLFSFFINYFPAL